MPIRVRCPECKTVLDVPTGVRPKCPSCGFAGLSGSGNVAKASASRGATFTASSSTQPQAQVEWGSPEEAGEWPAATGESGEWPTEGDAWPAEGEATETAWPAGGEAPAEGEATWGAAEGEWQAEGVEPAAAPAKPAKKGWFGRKK